MTDPLECLFLEAAELLMRVTIEDAGDTIHQLLNELVRFFDADRAYLRKNDHEEGVSVLISEAPRSLPGSEDHPLINVEFSADPLLEVSRTLAHPLVDFHGSAGETHVLVPLRTGQVTTGVLGVARQGGRNWLGREIQVLGAIATLLHHLCARLEAERELVHRALYDSLTGLPLRSQFLNQLAHLPGDASVVIVDVRDMRILNDGLSYASGNDFLAEISRRLKQAVRPTDLTARLEGDEFAVGLPDVSLQEAMLTAERLAEELSKPVDVRGTLVSRQFSVGVATGAASEGTDLVARAHAAKLEAKRPGAAPIVAYDRRVRQAALKRARTEVELQEALEAGDQLLVHYQPEFDLHTGEMLAVEALARWQHPTRGLLSAGEFIQVAEESGLVVDIGDIVLRQSAEALADWTRRYPEHPLTLRINASPAQLVDESLVSDLKAVVTANDLEFGSLCLEITEHVVISDVLSAQATLQQCAELGIGIAIDDFGTGYSSLEQLKNLPFDYLKIDLGFVRGLEINDSDTAIVDAILSLAGAFGVQAIAEGVETAHQLRALQRRNCDRAQGYLLSRPAPASTIEQYLANRYSIFDTSSRVA